MPRIARGLVDGFTYHVLNRGNGKQEVFHKAKDYEAFLDLLKEAKTRYSVEMFAYCLMPNHFHLVLRPYHADELSKFMHWLTTSHVRRYHRHYGTTGHVWGGRYKSFIIQDGRYLLMVMRYVEGNPVMANLVNSAKDWLWSSHRGRIGERFSIIFDKVPIELPEDWDKYVNEPLTNTELEKFHQSVTRHSPFGNPTWQIKICKELGLESTIRPRGRPRKQKK